MRMGQGVRTGLGHGGITCVLQTQFSSLFMYLFSLVGEVEIWNLIACVSVISSLAKLSVVIIWR